MKFKVGEKVECTIDSSYRVGTIKYVDEYGNAAIDFAKADNKDMGGCSDHVLIGESKYILDSYYKLYKEEKAPKVKIIIEADPETRITTAMYIEDNCKKAGVKAKCRPEDKWDANIGAQLAFRRLMDKVDATVMVNLDDVIKGLLKEEE